MLAPIEMMPTILNRNAPINAPNAFCAVEFCMSSALARGLAVVAAVLKACTIIESEKVVTASILEASILSIFPTVSGETIAFNVLGI